MILHHQHQVALDGFQTRGDIIAQRRQNLFLDDAFFQFLHLLKDILVELYSHLARVLNNAV